jgi:hypothetical protein
MSVVFMEEYQDEALGYGNLVFQTAAVVYYHRAPPVLLLSLFMCLAWVRHPP